MMKVPTQALFALLVGIFPLLAAADSQSDAITLLNRVYAATQRLSYSGTFVYQHDSLSETSRITRIVEGALIRERLEALDGQPREIVRSGDEVVCYLPALLTVRVDKYAGQRGFPAVLPVQLKEILDNYVIRRGDMERVAGYDCHVLNLEPRDNMRYGHKLWVDAQTGMVIRAKTFDERNEIMEQFAFAQLQIGGNIDRDRVKSSFAGKTAAWRVEDAAAVEANLAQAGWTLRASPPGFRKIMELRRTLGGVADVGHMVLSDGMAAISVFIEPSGQRPANPEVSRQGAINVYIRQLGGHRITVVGEAPAESVRYISHALAYRRPN
jgi:sigma-E factor negative regulatory protein RseB